MRGARPSAVLGPVFVLAACGAGENPSHSGSAIATAPVFDLEGVAYDVVTRSAQVKEGERVVIFGAVEDMELLENLAVHVRKLGAHPMVIAESERLVRRMYDDVPESLDAQREEWERVVAEHADVFLRVVPAWGPGLLAHVPARRFAARREANRESSEVRRRARSVEVGNGLTPSVSQAERFGMSRDELARLFWEGVQADPARLAGYAETLKEVLTTGGVLRVTHPNGTDISFRIDGRPVLFSDGTVPPAGAGVRNTWLPAGEVFLAPVTGTASGRVVVDRTFFRGQEIRDLTLTVSNGRLVSMDSPSDLRAVREDYDAAPEGKDVLSAFDVGINPGITSQRVLAWVPAGTVTLNFGENVWAGGDIAIDWSMPFHIPGTTVRVDDRVIVEDGVLKL